MRVLAFALALALPGVLEGQARAARYEDLVTLFNEWRLFQKPKLIDAVPDYTATAMAAQQRELPAYQARLKAIDTTGWSVAQQVDYHIVRAEMNGLDFDHRVLKPWAMNPAFYVSVFSSQSDQPAREGHQARGSIELWTYQFPLTLERSTELRRELGVIPPLLEQAKKNLTGNGKDLWTLAVRDFAAQSKDLAALQTRARVPGRGIALDSAIQRARAATDAFRAWLEREAPTKTGPSGVGIDHYNWYLKNVQLVPLSWQDEVNFMRRELTRSQAALALEENRNRNLPALEPIASAAEWERRFNAAVTEYVAFFRDKGIVSVTDYMEPALRAQVGRFSAGPREFFNEVNYRDPLIMLTHDYHWIDLARMVREPHASPIRRGPLLYNIFVTRTEGFATAMEEMMTHAGFVDAHPRARELIYVLIAERAARALGDLMMHANRFTLDQAAKFAVAGTPRGWLRANGNTVWGEQHLYLQQPAYGTSYLIGKMQIEQVLAERSQQLGDQFSLKRFMDDFNAVGLIPMSLARWEMTGQGDEIGSLVR
jgi:uncharacterized protein (DUF885 family)